VKVKNGTESSTPADGRTEGNKRASEVKVYFTHRKKGTNKGKEKEEKCSNRVSNLSEHEEKV
jgi:hypothetical protein